ncbi:hypothetical protein CEXT_122781 [Caerostris extrusa]|uniref:Uncharacterized protein n=1 Tax=Caerostris extrusa TaxID=172846 RepID=A0AAV4V0S2_CAEEX|nr:hypothetical protein CEXT_122781 [Caerostris extrusa]
MLSTPLLNEIIDVAFAPPWLQPPLPIPLIKCCGQPFGFYVPSYASEGREEARVEWWGWSDQIVRKLELQIVLFQWKIVRIDCLMETTHFASFLFTLFYFYDKVLLLMSSYN